MLFGERSVAGMKVVSERIKQPVGFAFRPGMCQNGVNFTLVFISIVSYSISESRWKREGSGWA